MAPNTTHDLFPLTAFQEALGLTSGMPRSRQGRMKLQAAAAIDAASADYEAVVKANFEAITGYRSLTQLKRTASWSCSMP